MAPTEIVVNLGLSLFSIVISAGIGIAVKSIRDRNKRIDALEEAKERRAKEQERRRAEEYEALKNGVRAILRDRIIQAEIHFCGTLHEITSEQKENVELMYTAYHSLGGNGVVTTAYNHLMSMPLTGKDD